MALLRVLPMTRPGSAARPTVLAHVAGGSTAATALRAGSVLFIVVLTAAAAQVSFPLPFTPVPFTVQPMVVLLGGAALGWRLGATAQVLYLLAGAAGLPVFAASGELAPGLLRLAGPTGGYLLSYPAAAAVTGILAQRGLDRRWTTSLLSMLAGLAVIYLGGVLGLAYGSPAPVGLRAALAAGVYPFVAADLVKVAAAAGLLPGLWRYLFPHARR